jgi:hypothetical protein
MGVCVYVYEDYRGNAAYRVCTYPLVCTWRNDDSVALPPRLMYDRKKA